MNCEMCGQPGAVKRMIVGTKVGDGWPVTIIFLDDSCFELDKASHA